ncbi:MAG: transporter sugar permease [Glaciihabitans sp.]|nr:transporter sugar permease [Glaciihabitans sp.]
MTSFTTPEASRKRRPRGVSRTAVAWLFLAPFAVMFVTYTAIPALAAVGFSLTDLQGRDLRNPFSVNFTGIENYIRLFSDDRFTRDIGNTLIFVVVGVPLTMALGLALAVALNSGIRRLRGVFRTIFFAPVVTNIVAIALIWEYAFNNNGTINNAIAAVGIEGPRWLDDPNLAMPVVILLGIWRNFGIAMILFLAGLQSVPEDVQEAAALDGASWWGRFWHITMPLLLPSILLVSVLLTVFFLQVFDEPYLLTDGGPLGSTESIALYTYKQFGFGNYGTSSASSVVTLALVALVSFVQFRLLRPRT